ncbi:unnamed protein product [Choristocarpus tenellus]
MLGLLANFAKTPNIPSNLEELGDTSAQSKGCTVNTPHILGEANPNGDDVEEGVVEAVSDIPLPVSGRRRPRSGAAIMDGRKYLSTYRRRLLQATCSSSQNEQTRTREATSLPETLIKAQDQYQDYPSGSTRKIDLVCSSPQKNQHLEKKGVKSYDENWDQKQDNELHGTLGGTDSPLGNDIRSAVQSVSPETMRQAGRDSQADFLLSVLGDENSRGDVQSKTSLQSLVASAPETYNDSQQYNNDELSIELRHALTSSGTSTQGWSTDKVEQGFIGGPLSHWSELLRVGQQNMQLGSLIEQQLGVALELCRGIKGGQGSAGFLSQNQVSSLATLHSSLQGLFDLTRKRNAGERLLLTEADALGGPSSVTDLLSSKSISAVDEGIEHGMIGLISGAESRPKKSDQRQNCAGWVTSGQLRKLEEEIRNESSMEIAALRSEKRKLKEKLTMFQRQMQLLEHQQQQYNLKSEAIGETASFGSASVSEREYSKQGKKGSGYQVQAGATSEAVLLNSQLEAEIGALRQQLEERDGLAQALRNALRGAVEESQPLEGGLHRLHTIANAGDEVSQAQAKSYRMEEEHLEILHGKQMPVDTVVVNEVQGVAGEETLENNSQGEDGTGFSVTLAQATTPRQEEQKHQWKDSAGGALSDGTDDAQIVTQDVGEGETTIELEMTAPQETRTEGGDRDEGEVAAGNQLSGFSELSPVIRGREGREHEQRWGVAGSIPGAALRVAWGTARAVGKTVGPKTKRQGPPYRTRAESHAVFIM